MQFSKEPRPVYSRELDILGFDKYWNYDKDDSVPLMWAEANNYIYKGRLVAQTKGGTFFTAPVIKLIESPEPEGVKLSPVNIDLMVSKNEKLFEAFVSDTIKGAYNTYLSYKKKVDIFHVSYSGGKDSEVALDIVQRALPHDSFVVIFGDTGMEFPDTYKSVEIAKAKCKKEGIRFYVAKSHLKPIDSWKKFGPPAATIRWCCSVHKTTPQLLLIKDIVGKNAVTEMAFVGVRADESVRRSGYDYISYGTKHKGQYSCNPILTWSSAEVYLYIYANKLHLNEAYKRGNTRAGCLVCPMSANRNDYLNNLCYNESTQPLLDIIHDLDVADKGKEERIRSYIENNGWKARKNGRDLSIAPKDYDESIIGGNLVITFKDANNDWFQWLKTVGTYVIDESKGKVTIDTSDGQYYVDVVKLQEGYLRISTYNDNTPSRTLFLKKLRIVCRKSHYCVSCHVCMANCKYGNLHFDEKGKLTISDKCIKCGKCLDIDTGCYVYKSLWLSKGLGNMNKKKSIDCYAAHGPKIEWFQEYVKLGNHFKTENSLGNNQVPAFNRFLRDSGVIIGDTETKLGVMLRDSNLEDNNIWAIMLANLAYTPEVGWYISQFGFNEMIAQSSIVNTLSTTEGVSASALKSIPAALKRIAALPLKNVGFGFTEKSSKEDGGAKFIRTPWLTPSPEVILYSLYKFAEACDGYYQFTMSRLYDSNVESDGVSPVRIFGIEEEEMKKILKGLSINHPDFISVTFTLDLDNINLREDKTAHDVLDLF
ncbi:phosphoadenosine phosphosulfate reductase domain-containing protein [Prevotella sp.]|uniref:phosphoadenosine phosphosulfate reductase domain-containing protein n=1 Tax=Prevotella sp. TaxID=59823 RepID=UPI00307C88CC